RRRTSFRLAPFLARATTRQASYDQILLCLHFAKRSESSAALYRFNRRSADASQKSQLWPHRSHRKMEAVAIENIRRTSRSTRAAQLERYLKSASGRAFAKRRF